MKLIGGIVSAGVLGLFLAGDARAAGIQDHLVCYKTKDPAKVQYALSLFALKQPEFTAKGCTVVGPTMAFCVPATKKLVQPAEPKAVVDGPTLDFDYVMYKMRCPRLPMPKKLVTDQLAGARVLQPLGPPQILLVPATKEDPPCGAVGALAGGVCGGSCPDGEACTFANGQCGCSPPPRPCGKDAAGVCGGECPAGSNEICEQRVGADGTAECGCFPRSSACGLASGANQCSGDCPQGQTCKTLVLNAGVSCACTN